MMSYEESKVVIDDIRRRYPYVFNAAIAELIDNGCKTLRDNDIVNETLASIDKRHNEAEKNGVVLWCTASFEKSIVLCEQELAKIDAYDIMTYIAYEVDTKYYEKTREEMRGDAKMLIELVLSRYASIREALRAIYDKGFIDGDLEYYGFEELMESVGDYL